MDTIIIRFEDNGSVRYDGKEYVESLSKVCRETSVTGELQISKSVMVKTKEFGRPWLLILSLPQPPPVNH